MADFHIWVTFAIIGLTIVAYASERFALELVALASLAALLVMFAILPAPNPAGETLGVGDLLSGFANPALATVLSLLIVGQGLFATDAMDQPARMVARMAGGSAQRALIVTLVTAAALSAVLNNTPVVVIFIPVLTVLAAQRNFAASRAMMPLSFMTILGGTTTLIGSSTNLLSAGVAARSGVDIGFFDLTVPGLIIAAVGSVYVLGVMPRILRNRDGEQSAERRRSGAPFIGEIRLGPRHPFLGVDSRSGLFPGLGELTPRLIVRRGVPFYPPFENIVLSEGDRLVVTTTRRAFVEALAGGSAAVGSTSDGVARDAQPPEPERQLGPDYTLAEAVVAPGSRHAGRTVRNAGIETMYGVDMIGVQRKSRMGRVPLADIRLEPGDTILVGGTESQFERLRDTHDLLLLEWSAEAVPQRRKAWIARTVFVAIIVLAALEVVPIAAAAVTGAILLILTGCLSLHQAARAFDRQIFLLVGASIAAATALEHTGGAQLIADAAVNLLAGQSPAVVLSGLFAIVAILTNVLTNNATAVLFTPIALGMASSLGAPPEAFVATVIFAANASFATPIGYQTNLLVMGPGRYSFSDFIKAGVPLVIIMWLTFSLVGPWYYGL